MHSNFAPSSSSSRDKDKKQTESGGNNLALLYSSLCTIGMMALMPTEVEVK